MSPSQRISAIREAFPAEGLFQDKDWKLSHAPLALPQEIKAQILALGPALQSFLAACDALYLAGAGLGEVSASLTTDLARWVTQLLDQGKPAWLIQHSRQARLHGVLPRVIRPDLILTERGLSIAEIDSVPGGMGLTAWLNETYAAMGEPVIGGSSGMVQGFADAFPQHQLLVSTEAADYAPEMRWLSQRLPWAAQVWHPSQWQQAPKEQPYYRFFELFDLPQVEHAKEWIESVTFSPPIKPYLEEKLWLALFHLPQLQDYWRTTLSAAEHALLMECIPQGWVLNPQPLPQDAVYPCLEIHHWSELKKLGRSARELVLKISGFSPLGWGSRGVHIGHDLSQADWGGAVDAALASFPQHPHILQRFERARVLEHPAWNPAAQLQLQQRCRVRLCPYFFVVFGQPQLSGVLATLCPEDKKILHGMRDAMMLPCV